MMSRQENSAPRTYCIFSLSMPMESYLTNLLSSKFSLTLTLYNLKYTLLLNYFYIHLNQFLQPKHMTIKNIHLALSDVSLERFCSS